MVSRTRFAPVLAVALTASALTGACSEPTCGPASLCEVTSDRCQKQAWEIARCYTGVEADGSPPVRVRTRAQLVEEYEQQLEERDEDEARDALLWRTGVALMGLTEIDADPVETYAYNLRWVAANFDGTRVTIVSEANPDRDVAAALLVHEFVHALQARRREDEEPLSLPTTDAFLASRAMGEGEAELYETFTLAEGLGFSLGELRDGAFQNLPWSIPSRRPYDNAYQSFTYDHGAWWAVDAWREGGADALAALVNEPPRTTAHVMRGPGWDGQLSLVDRQLREEFEAASRPVLEARFREVGWDSLGAWVLTHFALRDDWIGDSFHVLHDETADETVGIWRIAVGDAEAAEGLVDRIERWVAYLEERALDDDGDGLPVHHDIRREGHSVTWIASNAPCDDDGCVQVLEWTAWDEGEAKRFPAPLTFP